MPSFLKRIYLRRDLPWKWAKSMYSGFRNASLFDAIQTYCMFIGYPRSGHTLVASLLGAHRNIVIGDELDVVLLLQLGFRRNQIFSLILDRDRELTDSGRILRGRDYKVPNQWQGRFEELTVIGDKRGGASTRRLMKYPRLLGRLRHSLGIPLKFIHVVRNPYDNIASIARRDTQPMVDIVKRYFGLCSGVSYLRTQIEADEFIELRHEEMVRDPRGSLIPLSRRLGVVATEDYLNDCASIVLPHPYAARFEVKWTPELIGTVDRRMREFDFLSGYSYDDAPIESR